MVAIFGTTISPYLFFWQASQEVEDMAAVPGATPLIEAPEQAPGNFARIRIDTVIGMLFSNLIAFFIMLTTAVTLHAHGITDIETATQAASALRPIAGEFAFCCSASASSAPACWPCRCWRALPPTPLPGPAAGATGLAAKLGSRKAFYALIAVATLLGVSI